MIRFFRALVFSFALLLPFGISGQSSISTDSVLQLSTCPGENVIITFETTGSFGFFNTFYAELSDANGDFSNPDTIGSTVISLVHIILGQLPDDLGFGINYKVRVVSEDPDIVGEPSPNSIIITTIPGLDEISANPDEPICAPGTVSIQAGFGGDTYEWSNGESTQNISVAESGTYSVTITDIFTCKYYPDPVEVTIYDEEVTPVVSQEINILSSTPSASYQWYLDGIILTGDTSQSLEVREGGSYFVVTHNEYGCWKASSPIVVEFGEGIEVYPNPVGDLIHLKAGLVLDEWLGYKVFNFMGQTVREMPKEKFNGILDEKIETAGLPDGFYLLELNFKGRISFFNLVKQ